MSDQRRFTIAHVLHRLHLAGAEVLAADLSRRMRDRFNFLFLCLDDVGPLGEQLRGEGFDVINMNRRPGLDWSVARRIRGVVREKKIDLLHAHQYTPFFYAAVSRRMGTKPPPILFTEHGRHYPDRRKLKRVAVNKVLLKRHDRVTAVGEFIKQALVANEGIAAHRIEVVHNGIDPRKFHAPDAALRDQVRRELGLGPDQPAVLQVARFHPVKDHATALRAMAGVVRKIPGAVLLLAGDGDQRADIESQVSSLRIGDNVRLLGVRNDVPRLMAAADVFLLSSLSEGVSVTLLEAMGCELPITATDVGGNPEVVERNVTGLLSPRGDDRQLAENLAKLLADPALRRSMGEAGRARLLNRFTQDQMHARYAGIYEEMLAR